MNSLLIYNQNVANQLAIDFEEKLGENYKFQIGKDELLKPDFSVDEKINTILLTEIENKKYDAIFIPFSLSDDNYTEFIGLRFAFHIRLTQAFNNIQTPILFYGFDRAEEVNKLSDLGSLLFSKNVFTTDKISIDSFRKQIEYVTKQHKEIDNIDFIKRFLIRNIVSPSGNYATHHSITNEWSIYRWSKALKIENDQINQINKTIGSNLYFKYLKAKYPIGEIHELSRTGLKNNGNILFIDDELEKGWDSIFYKICFPKKYESFGAEFKKWDTQTIMDKTIEKVNAFNPDVVILDFRLHDDDFEVAKPKQVTGYKLLKQIKEINQGIQVIILSATNKIWNLIELQKEGADGFIMKESPELSVNEYYSEKAIRQIYKEINDKLKRAKVLKNLYNKITDIMGLINESKELNNIFYNSVSSNMEIGYKLLYDSFCIDAKYINYSYLQFFLIIEEYLKQPTIFEEGDNCYIIQGKKRFLVRYKKEDNRYDYAIKWDVKNFVIGKEENKKQEKSFLETNFKMSAVMLFKFGCSTSNEHNWSLINQIRNTKAAHLAKEELVTFDDMTKLIDFMLFIFNEKNYQEVDISKALPEPSYEDSLKLLKEKFNKKK